MFINLKNMNMKNTEENLEKVRIELEALHNDMEILFSHDKETRSKMSNLCENLEGIYDAEIRKNKIKKLLE